MMNCRNCGMELNGSRFCPNCGAPAAGQNGAPVMMDRRQRSLKDMEQMIGYFGAKKQWYDDFDAVSAEVEERTARSFAGWIGAAVISAAIGIFSEAFFFYIAAAGFVVLMILLKKNNKDKLAKAVERQNLIGSKLQAYYEEYGYCPVGLEYTKPATLNALYELIRKGRASEPGDAINIYLADLNQQEMLRMQQETMEAAKETAKNTKKAAKAARRSASYATANFWLK